MRGFFDLLIADEVHEFKGRGSAQGIAAGILADACGRSLTLTGTLLGGYASTLFHLLYRFSPEIRTEFGRSEEGRWISRYGFLEETARRGDDGGYDEDGRSSRRRRYRKTVRPLHRPALRLQERARVRTRPCSHTVQSCDGRAGNTDGLRPVAAGQG